MSVLHILQVEEYGHIGGATRDLKSSDRRVIVKVHGTEGFKQVLMWPK